VSSRWTYPPEFIEALAGHGLSPRADTTPALLRGALNDLYRYEIRRLRSRLLVGEFERPQYLDLVVHLRKKYWLLTLQLPAWEKICQGSDI
jgi:hypothetical protein